MHFFLVTPYLGWFFLHNVYSFEFVFKHLWLHNLLAAFLENHEKRHSSTQQQQQLQFALLGKVSHALHVKINLFSTYCQLVDKCDKDQDLVLWGKSSWSQALHVKITLSNASSTRRKNKYYKDRYLFLRKIIIKSTKTSQIMWLLRQKHAFFCISWKTSKASK